jgi:hypothetical protein
MTKEISVRHILYHAAITGCWLHFVAFLMISRTFEYRQVVLGIAALALAGAFLVLQKTKRTLPIEEQLPTWFYTFGYMSWGVGALIWFFAGTLAP